MHAIAGARAHEQLDLRERALSTLQNFARAGPNCVPMWRDDAVRGALLDAAAGAEAPKVRTAALGALCGLASADANKAPMWAHDALRAAVLTATGAAEPPATPGATDRQTDFFAAECPSDVATDARGVLVPRAAASGAQSGRRGHRRLQL